MWESNFAVYKRIWRSNLLGSLVQPLLYLLGMGVGVGALVDQRHVVDASCSAASTTSRSSPRR